MTEIPATTTPDVAALRLVGGEAEKCAALLNTLLDASGISREGLARNGDTLDFLEKAAKLNSEELQAVSDQMRLKAEKQIMISQSKGLSGFASLFAGVICALMVPAAVASAPAIVPLVLGGIALCGIGGGLSLAGEGDKATITSVLYECKDKAARELAALSPEARQTVADDLTRLKAARSKVMTLGL